MSNNREFRESKLRRKDDTAAADPAVWAYVDNNSFLGTVGGTADDGDYTVTVTPVAPPSGTTSFAIVFDRAAGETDSQIGAGLVTETDTLLAVAANAAPRGSVLSHYLVSATNVSGVVTFVVQPDAPAFTVTMGGTGGTGTLTLSPDDIFPITYATLGWSPIQGARTQLEVSLVPVDSNDVPIAIGTGTADVTVRRMIGRGDGNPVGVSSATTETAMSLGASLRVPANGGRFGVTLGALAGTVTGIDAIEVWVREVTE